MLQTGYGRVSRRNRWASAVMSLAVAAGLSACTGSTTGIYPQFNSGTAPIQAAPTGEVIGNGSVRVTLLLPQSATANAGQIATVFRNAAELAMNDFQGADIQVLVKDTGGTAAGGRAAAEQAISEGAELILGPVFAPAVSGAGAAARVAGVPIVAFSSDASAAARGVYLLSFMPQQDTARIISYAAAQGRRSYVALIPDNGYGAVVEAAFRQAVGSAGGRIVGIERYKVDPARGVDSADLQAKTTKIASVAKQADAIFLPDGGGVPGFIAQVLSAHGVAKGKVTFLGSGQWDNAQVLNEPALAGGLYPAPVKGGFTAFSARYKAAYGVAPPRNATLAYDATRLAAGLVANAGTRRFSTGVLTNRDGFLGVDGVFRFNGNGTNDRGLAVFEATGNGSRMVDQAPQAFPAGS